MNIYTKLSVAALLAAAICQTSATEPRLVEVGIDGDLGSNNVITLNVDTILLIKLTNKTGAVSSKYMNYWQEPVVSGDLKFLERKVFNDGSALVGAPAINVYSFTPLGVGSAKITFTSNKGDIKVFDIKIAQTAVEIAADKIAETLAS
jgi:hypothetical protein